MHADKILELLFNGETVDTITKSLGLSFDDIEGALKDTDSVICPACQTITHIGGLVGDHTNDCPICGSTILKG